MNWDDLRIVMAVQKGGSYAAAAAHLHVDESTVARRLTRLQKDLGVTLFEAIDGRRQPTNQCEAILAQVAQIAQHIERIEEVRSPIDAPAGTYRIAATDSVGVGIVAPNMAGFLAENPGIRLQVVTSTENVNFSRWQADLAIRLRKPDKGDFSISKTG